MNEYTQFPHLMSPYKIGKLEIKNRMVPAPMGLMGATDNNGCFTQQGYDYYGGAARGGFGLVIAQAVHPDDVVDPMAFYPPPMKVAYEYSKAANTLIKKCHAYGTKIFVQIHFGQGRNGMPGSKGPSENPYCDFPGMTTPELTIVEIEKKIQLVIECAKFMKDIGFDGVEMVSMHWGYLLGQFAAAYTNRRTDEYGGSLENRIRPLKKIIIGIKEVCGEDFPISVRFSVKGFVKDFGKASLFGENDIGMSIEEGVEIAKLLESYGADVLNIDVGTQDAFYYLLPPPYLAKGYILPYAEAIKKAVNIPVIVGAARMNDPFLSEKAIAEGKIDGIVLGRQRFADPYYARKVQMGRPDKIRPCIGCNLGCNNEIVTGKDQCCAVNPELMREAQAEKTKNPKKIAVIGAGVAGMEVARTATNRGHTVEIYEKDDVAGGLMLAAGHHSFKSEILDLNRWYLNELAELNVPIHLNQEMNPEKIKALDVDAVVLTVGSDIVMPPIPGIDSPKVVTSLEAAMDLKEMGGKVVVVGGGQTGCEIAYDLALKGKKVYIVEALDALMLNGAAHINRTMMLDLIEHYGIDVYTGNRITAINETGAVITAIDGTQQAIEADNVVMSIGFKYKPSMEGELFGCGKEIYSIPTGVGNIMDSVRDAYEVATHI